MGKVIRTGWKKGLTPQIAVVGKCKPISNEYQKAIPLVISDMRLLERMEEFIGTEELCIDPSRKLAPQVKEETLSERRELHLINTLPWRMESQAPHWGWMTLTTKPCFIQGASYFQLLWPLAK